METYELLFMTMKNKKKNDTDTVSQPLVAIDYAKRSKLMVAVFAIVVWGLLAFYEPALLKRIEELSLFVFDETFWNSSMNVPAGLLGYIGCFLMQFFYYPVLGAAIYVALLVLVYFLVKKIFTIPDRWSSLAMIPSVLLLATNTQLGYWIFYIKHPGYYYVTLLGVIVILLSVWLYRLFEFSKEGSWLFGVARRRLHYLFAPLFLFFGFPLFGVYASAASLCMAVISVAASFKREGKVGIVISSLFATVVLFMVVAVPLVWHESYQMISQDYVHAAGLPAYHWVLTDDDHFNRGLMREWLPFILLFATLFLFSLFGGSVPSEGEADLRYKTTNYVILMLMILFACLYWYNDNNFRIENKQNFAMWEGDWRNAADYARDADVPTRQIVMNKNIALLYLGRAGEEMFTYPDGSSDIDSPVKVHLTQTGGKMSYYNYGNFNYCYRWCVEDAVEYGWKVEYLKHSVRCMLLSGEYKLARRYINILKHTLFHSAWAERYEEFLDNPARISKEPEFKIPLQMYSSYTDILDVDDSFVEVYLMKKLSKFTPELPAPIYAEAQLMAVLTRKDAKMFWPALSRYFSTHKLKRLPLHYQEALLLFSNLNSSVDVSNIPIDKAVRMRFNAFMQRSKQYAGMSEEEMAQYFTEDFGNTYWYFYFFVRKIKSN